MASVTWNAPVSLHKKPKGARKQAAEARLEQYKQWIVASLPKPNEPAPSTTSVLASGALSKVLPSPKPTISKESSTEIYQN